MARQVIFSRDVSPQQVQGEALDQITQGITTGLQQYGQLKAQQEKTKRQRALEDELKKQKQFQSELAFTQDLARQGVSATPEQIESFRSGDIQGLAGLAQQQAEQVKAQRENERERLRQERERKKSLQDIQIQKGQEDLRQSGLPFEQTREGQKFAAMQKIKKPKQPKESQFKAGTFARRLQQSEQAFGDLAKKGFDPTSTMQRFQGILPGEFQSSEFQRQDQAERNFVNALLRRESGAAISDTEFDSAEKQYFPRPGDSIDVVEQKRRNREQAMAGMSAEAGPALDQIPLISQVQTAPDVQLSPVGNAVDAVLGSQVQAGEVQSPKTHPQANDALIWAQQNPNDPRAAQILERLK